jgi:HK97 family phage prohead protease
MMMTVVAYRSFPTDRDPWDGPREVREAEVADLRLMATWFDGENPDAKGSYKLPHHRADNKHISWRGLTAAMGALLGARGGVDIPGSDRQGVYNHLARHYRDDFDEDPPEFRSAPEPASMQHKALFAPAEIHARKEKRTIEGYASIFDNRDLVDDIVVAGAFARTLSDGGPGSRSPLLWQHNVMAPIGRPLEIREDSRGLYFKDKISKTRQGDEALELAHDGVVTGVSIGYDIMRHEIDDTGDRPTRRLLDLELWERSLVTFPANEQARIVSVRKSLYTPDEARIRQIVREELKRDRSRRCASDLAAYIASLANQL